MEDRLITLLGEAGKARVLLVGDFMLDRYVYGNTDRISPEAPVLVLNVAERHERPGGAGSVAVDLAALGAEVACLGAVGDDDAGATLKNLLAQLPGCDTNALLALPNRCTTTKERIVGLAQHRHPQQLMRIDEENSQPIDPNVMKTLTNHLQNALDWCDIVCVEDYNKGLLDAGFCQHVIAAAHNAGKRVVVDPALIPDYARYAGAYLVKPNRRELGFATGITINSDEHTWRKAAARLTDTCNIENVVLTLDKEGSFWYQKGHAGQVIATRPRNVYDVTGAGDMVLAVLAVFAGADYGQTEPATLDEVVRLANVAGGLEVERFGAAGISRDEMTAELHRTHTGEASKMRSLQNLLRDVAWHRRHDRKIVFTNGCFDLLHPGHVNLLSFAKKQADVLIVAINSDRSVHALKGPTRPILRQQERAALIAALAAVDYVIIFDEQTPEHIIRQVNPDILVKGSDWVGAVVGQEWVEAHGGQVRLMPLKAGFSTTNIIEKVIETTNHNLPSGDS